MKATTFPKLKPGDVLDNGATVIASKVVAPSEVVVLGMQTDEVCPYVTWLTCDGLHLLHENRSRNIAAATEDFYARTEADA